MTDRKIKKIRKKIHEDITIFRGKTPLWKRLTLWLLIVILLIDILIKLL
nr:MAG TPA: hypothetical protein [Caudoviricetes sp.]